MRHWIVIFFVILLAGCATSSGVPRPKPIEPFDGALAPEMQSDKAIVVLGLSIDARTNRLGLPVDLKGGWIKVDPYSWVRDPSVDMEILALGGLFSSAAFDRTRYDFYALPGGTYALGWFSYGREDHFFPTDFQEVRVYRTRDSVSRYFSPLARAKEFAPSFTIVAGEVVYLGDLIVDVSRAGPAVLSLKSNEEEVQKILAERGYSEAPKIRLLQRLDGKPIERLEIAPGVGTRSQ